MEPTDADRARVEATRLDIEDALDDAIQVRLTGSYARDTALRRSSDADYLVIFARAEATHGGKLVDSGRFLQNVMKQLLQNKKFQSLELVRDGQAIRATKGLRTFDIVPAIYQGPVSDSNGQPAYQIANGTGEWQRTSPDAHGRYLRNADQECGGRLKVVIRAVKELRHTRAEEVPLRSVYIDFAVAESGVAKAVGRPHTQAVAEAIAYLHKLDGAAIDDPTGVSGKIACARTDAQEQTVRASLRYAADHAASAQDAEGRADHAEAVRQWNLVYNREFE